MISRGVMPKVRPALRAAAPFAAAAPGPVVAITAPQLEDDGPAGEGQGRLPERLGERGGGMDRGAQLPGRSLEEHRRAGLGDEVRHVRADEVDAEDLIAVAVGDDLGEALVVAADERLAVGDEGELAGLEGQAVALALLLAAPDRGDLRPAVGRAGRLQVIHLLRLRADDGGRSPR